MGSNRKTGFDARWGHRAVPSLSCASGPMESAWPVYYRVFLLRCKTSNDRHTVWLTVALSPRLLTGSKLKVVDGGRIVPVDPSPCPTKGSIYLPWQANDKLRPHAFRTTPHAQENMPASEPEPIPRPLISLQFYITEQVQKANDVYIHDLQV